MNTIKVISALLCIVILSNGCTTYPSDGARGPELVSSGRSTGTGHYAEVGLKFSTWGDFVAMCSPSRWQNPVETGGSLSWVNPVAWSEDAGRTARILIGEAAMVGGVVVAATSGGDGGGSSGGEAPAAPTEPGPAPDTPFPSAP